MTGEKRKRGFLGYICARAGKKIRSERGFTFTELLTAGMIMLLSSLVIVNTLALAVDHYKARTADSDAEMLLNTLCEDVQDQLSYVKVVVNPGVSGSLQNNPYFKSTATNLATVECQLTYLDQNNANEMGYLMLRYRIKNETGGYNYIDYRLGREADFKLKFIKPKASILYTYNATENQFDVKVTIRDENNLINEHAKEFIVQPILEKVATI
ncbi:MAG: type II secretion system GspH family protein [Lachnospiraceae bacterium]|nr:type II secretion system GspH family protein [Lachnospiraceae bacterium]